MATQRVRYSATVTDSDGIKAAITSYVLATDTQTLAQLATSVDTWATLLDATTDGKIVAVRAAVEPVFTSGIDKSGTFGDSFNGVTGVINFSVPTSGRLWGLAIPAVADALRSGGGLVDVGGALAAIEGLLSADTAPYIFTCNDWLALGAAVDTFLGSRKRGHLPRRSRRVV